MKYYKSQDNEVFAYDENADPSFIKAGLTEIDEETALALACPPKTKKQDIEDATAHKNELRRIADSEISWLQDAVDAGIATDNETALLAAWKNYRVQVMRINVDAAPDIEWPTPPAE